MSQKTDIQWLKEPEDHDYPAAASYLSILLEPATVTTTVKKLQAAPMAQFKAKDIFRASGLPLLGAGNLHVDKDRKKITDGEKISPILLVRTPAMGRVVIADGYHRLCATYSLDEDAVIPCKIV